MEVGSGGGRGDIRGRGKKERKVRRQGERWGKMREEERGME